MFWYVINNYIHRFYMYFLSTRIDSRLKKNNRLKQEWTLETRAGNIYKFLSIFSMNILKYCDTLI